MLSRIFLCTLSVCIVQFLGKLYRYIMLNISGTTINFSEILQTFLLRYQALSLVRPWLRTNWRVFRCCKHAPKKNITNSRTDSLFTKLFFPCLIKNLTWQENVRTWGTLPYAILFLDQRHYVEFIFLISLSKIRTILPLMCWRFNKFVCMTIFHATK